jgi:hypothetical protein
LRLRASITTAASARAFAALLLGAWVALSWGWFIWLLDPILEFFQVAVLLLFT